MSNLNILRIANIYFRKENESIDDQYYDKSDVNIDADNNILNLRKSFEIWSYDEEDRRFDDRMADAAGHYESCSFYIIEVKTSDINKAKKQLKTTAEYIMKKGYKVQKIAIILDLNRWHYLANKYRISSNALIFKKTKKKRNNNERIYISHKGRIISKNIYVYLEDFKKFKLDE